MLTLAKHIDELACAGVTQIGIEAVLGRHMDESELAVFRSAQDVRRLEGRPVMQVRRASGPMTVAERVAAHRAGKRELGELRPIAHPERRESFRFDLLGFGLAYCMTEFAEDGETILVPRMLRRAPSARMERFVGLLQGTVLNGGNRHVRWPRGKGKTTWVKIAILWCIAYGHHPFVVILAATKAMAGEAASEIWTYCTEDRLFAEDFPEIAQPLADVAMTPQRMRVQTYHGLKTHIADKPDFSYKRFARLDGFPKTGVILAWRGADQAIRGLNIDSFRPTFVFVDDPQTDVSAKSPAQVADIEKRIEKTLLSLGDTSKMISAVMASTPIEPDDVSERFADADLHPEWQTTTERLVVQFGPKEWADRYIAALVKDDLARDTTHAAARAFYAEHRAEIERGVEMMDDLDFDPRSEISAYQHALNRLHIMKETAFFSELQMSPKRERFAFEITPLLILSRVRKDVPRLAVPDGFVLVVAATDINPSYALTTSITAFARDRTAFVLEHVVSPVCIDGKVNDTEFARLLYAALAEHGRALAALGVKIDGWGIDASGKQFDAVTAFAPMSFQICGIPACAMAGRAATRFNPLVRTRVRDAAHGTVLCADGGRKWLAWDADMYKETAQRSWATEVGAPGGLSMFDGAGHEGFAVQVANEQLVAKKERADGRVEYTWRTREPHDFGDCMAMCYALAASQGISGGASGVVGATVRAKKARRRVRIV